MALKVGVLGHTGMLGSTVYGYLQNHTDIDVYAIHRRFMPVAPEMNLNFLDHLDYIINCIGLIKPKCEELGLKEAFIVNSWFPHHLGEWADSKNIRVIQIATDCVFSGKRGHYREADRADAEDSYGLTKRLGEVFIPSTRHVRCSIIGPEPEGRKRSLLEWLRSQQGIVDGYLDHTWNGVTTLHYAKICEQIMMSGYSLPHCFHLVPSDKVSKYELLCMLNEAYDLGLDIRKVATGCSIDRSLGTVYPDVNRELWYLAGYNTAPTIKEMISELVEYGNADVSDQEPSTGADESIQVT
jgi:dTDP-4-dehydrorhamnose reductase